MVKVVSTLSHSVSSPQVRNKEEIKMQAAFVKEQDLAGAGIIST
jgi:hypothetical protein